MVDILSEDESTPATYPPMPDEVSTQGATVPRFVVWDRIEDWIAYRWGEREVVWIVEGPGTFVPRLKPATIDTVEIWRDDQWQTVTLDPAPIGYPLDPCTYRFTATVGSTEDPPPTLNQAYIRLAEYMGESGADPARGHTSVTDGDYSFDRPATYAARALHYSGAADLLRAYR